MYPSLYRINTRVCLTEFPANRQGRIATDVIAGRNSHFRGTQGTSTIGLFGATIAWTGVSQKMLIPALLLDDVVLGGGNTKRLTRPPQGCRMGDNANAFIGGFRLWEDGKE